MSPRIIELEKEIKVLENIILEKRIEQFSLDYAENGAEIKKRWASINQDYFLENE